MNSRPVQRICHGPVDDLRILYQNHGIEQMF